MLKAAVIGASGFGGVHCADLLRQHEQGRLAISGAVVRHPAKAAEMCDKLRAAGATIYPDHQRMLADLNGKLDLCMIPTSIPTHAELTIAALAAGSHVFVEKPAAATVAQVDAMQAAADKADRIVAVGFQNIYAVETMVMKRAILNKDIGELVSMKCLGMWPRLDRYYDSSWIGHLHAGDQPVYDSPANNAMAHQVNLMCFLAGQTLETAAVLDTAEAELYRAHEIETGDIAVLRLKTKAGVPLLFIGTHASEASRNPEIVITGTKGWMHWSFESLHVVKADGSIEDMPTGTGLALRDAMMGRVLDRIEGGPGFICDLAMARTHALAIAGMHQSTGVNDVPRDVITRTPSDGSVKTTVAGLDELLGECFSREMLPSEVGRPWTVAGKVVPIPQ
ncbi:MAG TPA: Gfo/Idh/MocA family oxidoreductase [Devosiaceae bacterium]|jgi:predicted dehydrogenase